MGPANSNAVYAQGYLLFLRDQTLMAQPFDNRRLELKGQAAGVAEQVDVVRTGATLVGFSASADILALPPSDERDLQLAWYDRAGNVVGTIGEPGAYQHLAISPEGTRMAVTKGSEAGRGSNLWLLDLSRDAASARFSFGSLVDSGPVWSPDGSRIVFSSNRDGPFNLYQKPVNGVKDEELLLKSSEDNVATSWSRDGRFLLYTVVPSKGKGEIWVLPMEGDRKPVAFLATRFNESQAQFSPDRHWVAYTSDESGHNEVYVGSFSMNSAGTAAVAGGKWPISNGGGTAPHWRADGRELFYDRDANDTMAVEIATIPSFRAGIPHPLGSSPFRAWDSAADGKRFIAPGIKRGQQPATVVLNWQAGLKK